jgi:hypothetical protein
MGLPRTKRAFISPRLARSAGSALGVSLAFGTEVRTIGTNWPVASSEFGLSGVPSSRLNTKIGMSKLVVICLALLMSCDILRRSI